MKGVQSRLKFSNASLFILSNGNRTDWSPVRSVIVQVISKSDLFITSMITDRIGRHELLLPINHKNLQFPRKEE